MWRRTKRAARRGSVHSTFNATRDAFLITIGDDLYVYDISTRTSDAADRLCRREDSRPRSAPTAAASRSSRTTISSSRAIDASGEKRADVGRQRRICSTARSTGSIPKSSTAAATIARYWWSPDSSRIAFLQFDETAVPEYTLIDDIPYHPRSSAGTIRRPAIRIRRCGSVSSRAAGGDRALDRHRQLHGLPHRQRRLDAGQPRGRRIRFRTATQTWLDLNRADADTGGAHTSSGKRARRGSSDGRTRASIRSG